RVMAHRDDDGFAGLHGETDLSGDHIAHERRSAGGIYPQDDARDGAVLPEPLDFEGGAAADLPARAPLTFADRAREPYDRRPASERGPAPALAQPVAEAGDELCARMGFAERVLEFAGVSDAVHQASLEGIGGREVGASVQGGFGPAGELLAAPGRDGDIELFLQVAVEASHHGFLPGGHGGIGEIVVRRLRVPGGEAYEAYAETVEERLQVGA